MTTTEQQMLSVIRKQLAQARKRAAGLLYGALPNAAIPMAEGGQIPSDNEAFLYVATSDGRIVIEADSSFVAEQIAIAPAWSNSSNSPATPWQSNQLPRYGRITFEDANSGRKMADSTVPNQNGSLNTQADVAVAQSIPLAALIPAGVFNSYGQPASAAFSVNQYDYWFRFPAGLLLPRSGAVRVAVEVNGAKYYVSGVVLAGYKVYG